MAVRTVFPPAGSRRTSRTAVSSDMRDSPLSALEASASSGLSVRTVTTIDGWSELATEWNQLVAQSVTDSVFVTFEWLSSWWQCFASPGDSLHIVMAFRGAELCAAAPLLKRRERRGRISVVSLRSLTNVHTPRYDWLWRKDDSRAIRSVIEAVHRDSGWDTMALDYVPSDSPTLRALEAFVSGSRYRANNEPCMSSPWIPISGAWADYYGSLSTKLRSNTRYAERKLGEMGTLALTEVRGGAQLAAALRQAYLLEQSSWKGTEGTAIADHPGEERFYSEVAASASERGWFRLFFLELDGRPIAFDYCLDHRQTCNLVKIGYEPTLGKHSPGNVLRMQVLERLFEEGRHDQYDMLGAASEYKLRWTRQVRDLRTFHLFRPRLKALVAYQLQFGIKERLKRYPALDRALRAIKRKWVGAVLPPQ